MPSSTPSSGDLRELLRVAPPTTLLMMVERWVEAAAQDRADEQRVQDAKAGAWWSPRRWVREGLEAWRRQRQAWAKGRAIPSGRLEIPVVAPDQVQDLLGDCLVNEHLRKDPDDPAWAVIMKHLLDHGARLPTADTIKRNALYMVLFHGAEAVLMTLPRRMLADAMVIPTSDGFLPWHMCVMASKVALVRAMLDEGVDPLIKDARGNTPLHSAASACACAAARLLLDAGASVDVLNAAGQTPLCIVAEERDRRRALGSLQPTDEALRLHNMLTQHRVDQEREALRAVLRPTDGQTRETAIAPTESTKPNGVAPEAAPEPRPTVLARRRL